MGRWRVMASNAAYLAHWITEAQATCQGDKGVIKSSGRLEPETQHITTVFEPVARRVS
jgi:hypothetical protein